MIGSPDHPCVFRSLPVSFKLWIRVPNTLRCLYENKTQFDLFYLHGANRVPRDHLLILRNINAMN